MILDLKELSALERQDFLQHAIAPRPICFASTIDSQGNVNLSPFSFFNLFSTTPPILVFSPARRVRNNTTKHTLENVLEIAEVVVNIVDFDMVHQASLSSCEYPRNENEFIKAGLTPEPATLVKPPMVKESKVKMECRVIDVRILGTEGGSGNLVICEILRMHIHESILDEHGKIDQRKLHHVARLGGDWYCKVDEHNLFLVEKPNTRTGIGVDVMPSSIRNSSVLSGNNLGQLANVDEYPAVEPSFADDHLKQIILYYHGDPAEMEKELHRYAKKLLEMGKVSEAWQVLLAGI